MGLVAAGGGESSSSSSSLPSSRPHDTLQPDIKTVRFTLGKGNKTDAKLVVVHKSHITDDPHLDSNSKGGEHGVSDKQRMPEFIRSVLLHDDFLGSEPPGALISVTGAAAAYNMDAKLAQNFCKGLVNAAKATSAWIVSGGTDVGIMHYVGEANRTFIDNVPTIGFATYNKINNKKYLKTRSDVAEYDATAPFIPRSNVNLNANHSHFVLIEGNEDKWGQEIEARLDFEEYISSTCEVPSCIIVVNGGPGTLNTVAEGVTRRLPVIIFEGTGRAADVIAREVRKKRNMPYTPLQQMNITPELQDHLDKIIANEYYITLYSADQGPLDLAILKTILTYQHGYTHTHTPKQLLQRKMDLAVHWNRPDLVDYLLEEANNKMDILISSEDFNDLLSSAVELSLCLDRPALFRLLMSKGARVPDFNLNMLYMQDAKAGQMLNVAIERYTPYIPTVGHRPPSARSSTSISIAQSPDQSRSFLLQTQDRLQPEEVILSAFDQNVVRSIFTAVHPVFHHYAKILPGKFRYSAPTTAMQAEIYQSDVSMNLVPPIIVNDAEATSGSTYTDAMIYAIVMGKFELAKVMWEEATLPVHAALLASGLCKGIAGWLRNEQQAYMDAAEWFEQVAVTLIENLSYENAKMMLTFLAEEVRYDAMQIAVMTECKDFVGNVHVQRFMDELLYSNEKGGIPPGTNFLRVIACIVFPFISIPSKTYANFLKKKEKGSAADAPQAGFWYHFYGLPYTKFWLSTLCYIGYLMLLAVVLVNHQDSTSVSAAEIVLWVWMLAYVVEEADQAYEAGLWGYFKYASNQMDSLIVASQVCYIGCAIAATHKESGDPSSPIHLASMYLLIIATIISYVRFLDVFSINKDLGTLYYVMKKIMVDVFMWLFVFILFGIGFQISFMALVGDNHKWTPTTKGGTFMGAVYIILGDDNVIHDLADNIFGSILVASYSIIAHPHTS